MPLPRLHRPFHLVSCRNYPHPRLLSTSRTLATKWGVFTDIHFQPDDLPRIVSTADWIARTFEEQKVSQIICLGDILNTREHVNVQALSACVAFLKDLRKIAPLQILLGNHDMNLRHSGRVSALDVLDTGVDCSVYRDITKMKIDGIECLMVPWHENHEVVVEKLSGLDEEEKARTFMFGHLAVNGAVQQAAVSERYAARQHSGVLKGRSLAGFKGVFLGHFHIHQKLGDNQAWYVGAPMQHHFGDSGDVNRGLALLNPLAKEGEELFELVRNPEVDIFRTVSLQELKTKEQTDFDVDGKRISLKCNAVDLPEFETWRDKLIDAGAGDVRQRLQVGTEAAIATGIDSETLPADEAAFEEEAEKKAEEYYQPLSSESFIDSLPAFLQSVDPTLVSPSEHQIYLETANQIIRESDATNPLQPTSTSSHLPVFHARIRTLTIENFFSVQGSLKLHFHQLQPGTWFIVGPNGAGKSLILEAIVWCLFGRTLRNDMSASDPVNDIIKKNCAVRIDFENGYSVERFRNYPSRAGGKGPALKLYKNGQEVDTFERGEVNKTQAALERDVLGCDFSMLTKSVVFGDDGRGAANFLTLDRAERREVLEDLLGVARFDGYLTTAREERKKVENERLEVKIRMDTTEDEIRRYETEKLKLEQDIPVLEKRKKNVEQELEALKEEEEKFEREKDGIEKTRDEMKKFQKVHEKLAELEKLEKRVGEIEIAKGQAKIFLPAQKTLKELNAEQQKLGSQASELNSEIRSATRRDQEIGRSITELQRNMNKGVCPTCKQNLVDKTAVESHVSSQQTMREEAQSRLKTYQADLEKLDQAMADLNRRKNELLKTVQIPENVLLGNTFLPQAEYDSRIRALVTSVAEKGSELSSFASGLDIDSIKSQYTPAAVSASLQQSEKLLSLYRNLTTRRSNLTNTLTATNVDLSRNTTQLSTLTTTLTTLATSLSSLTDQHATLSSQYRILLFWEAAFSPTPKAQTTTTPNLRQHLISASIPLLNHLISLHLTRLSPNLPLSFTPSLSISPPISKRSSGQRKRLNLAVLFALFQLARYRSRFRADFVMLDEVFDALDVDGQRCAAEMIEEVEGVRNVWVVSHAEKVWGEGGKVGMGGKRVLEVRMTPQGTAIDGPEGVVEWCPPEGEIDLREGVMEESMDALVEKAKRIRKTKEAEGVDGEAEGKVKRKRRTKKEMEEARALAELEGPSPPKKKGRKPKSIDNEEVVAAE
ncbi:P-loop containing nucleoside triphosphate hydrolase protein [Ascodesmis nigricans]|uniref:P-loop containing nucleoside triphosphate hydrolase protein n=1 Tax=Ascodesmis nigricans TaxID=341454 RepID=A0A4S2N3R1_9PEZI|nr:P-loop containing nucleoside triphosphate hydrolase protein [Ascodesmis nigricans]